MIIDFINKGGGGGTGTPLNKTLTSNGSYTYSGGPYKPVSITVNVEGTATPISSEKWEYKIGTLESEEYTALNDSYDSHIIPILENFVYLDGEGKWTAEFSGNGNVAFDNPDICYNINALWYNGEWVDFYDYSGNFYDESTGKYKYPQGTKIKFSVCQFYGVNYSVDGNEWSDKCEYQDFMDIDGVKYAISNSDYGKVATKISDNTIKGYVSETLYTIPDRTKLYFTHCGSYSNGHKVKISKTDGTTYYVYARGNMLMGYSSSLDDNPTSLLDNNGQGTVGSGMVYNNAKVVNGGINNISYSQIELVGGQYMLNREGDNVYFGDNTDYQWFNLTDYYVYEYSKYMIPALPLAFPKDTNTKQTNFIVRTDDGEPFKVIAEWGSIQMTVDGTTYTYSGDGWDSTPPTTSDYYSSYEVTDNYLVVNTKSIFSNNPQVYCYIKN